MKCNFRVYTTLLLGHLSLPFPATFILTTLKNTSYDVLALTLKDKKYRQKKLVYGLMGYVLIFNCTGTSFQDFLKIAEEEREENAGRGCVILAGPLVKDAAQVVIERIHHLFPVILRRSDSIVVAIFVLAFLKKFQS